MLQNKNVVGLKKVEEWKHKSRFTALLDLPWKNCASRDYQQLRKNVLFKSVNRMSFRFKFSRVNANQRRDWSWYTTVQIYLFVVLFRNRPTVTETRVPRWLWCTSVNEAVFTKTRSFHGVILIIITTRKSHPAFVTTKTVHWLVSENPASKPEVVRVSVMIRTRRWEIKTH